MADKRAYFKMDVGYFMNPKVVAVAVESPTAILLHLGSIAYATQHLTDGKVPKALILRLSGATADDATLLLKAGLWEDLGNGSIEPHDYLEHQRSAAEVKHAVDKATKASRARWNPNADASSNAPSNAPSISQAMPDALLDAMPRERERKKERTTPVAAAPDEFDEFYALYPKKVNPRAAKAKWVTTIKRTDPSVILAGLRAQLPQMSATEAKFIPAPDVWLNKGKWADEVAAPVDDGFRDQWARAIHVGPPR